MFGKSIAPRNRIEPVEPRCWLIGAMRQIAIFHASHIRIEPKIIARILAKHIHIRRTINLIIVLITHLVRRHLEPCHRIRHAAGKHHIAAGNGHHRE